ncbi:hypothetical protein MYX65_10175, partial [Acidobacteria bacterium AH-259-L09]|nr:hypothetical protein [Acidobacteria bacterium AH-259-L09]
DGRLLVFPFPEAPRGKDATGLKVISTAGGEPRELLSLQKPHHIYGRVLTWTLDGRYVIFGKGKEGQEKVELWRIPVEGGEPEKIGLEIDQSTYDLRFHPDGRQVAFSARQEVVEIWALENFLPELSCNE